MNPTRPSLSLGSASYGTTAAMPERRLCTLQAVRRVASAPVSDLVGPNIELSAQLRQRPAPFKAASASFALKLADWLGPVVGSCSAPLSGGL